MDDFRAYQRLLTVYFHHWRRGERNHPNTRLAPAVLAEIVRFPQPGRWRGFSSSRPAAAHNPRAIRRAWDAAGPRETEAVARDVARGLEGGGMGEAGYRFVKVLGWGGLGVAGLFEKVEGGGRVVCKMDLRRRGRGRGVEAEREMHLRTAGARHIVQRVVLNDRRAMRRAQRARRRGESAAAEREAVDDDGDFEMVDPNEVNEDMEMGAAERLDLDPKVLFIEFMTRGRMDDYIGKAGEARTRFPDQVLWRMFECLYRGVIGMAYPDAFVPVMSNPRTENVRQVSESWDGFPVMSSHGTRETMVHFDIDPLNVLVGDYDHGEHSTVPLLKIADLGIAKIFDRDLRTNQDRLWSLRRCGKNDTHTPEQFSQEWDHVSGTPWDAMTNTAGNYNWWTNLYQVALIMWSLITLHQPEYPPVVEQLDLTHPDGSTSSEWTYGGYLLSPRFAGTSATLRHLVALCLVDNPMRRPAMQTLEETILRHVNAAAGAGGGPETDDDDDGDRAAREWGANMFGAPPPPPEPEPEPEPEVEGEEEEEDDDDEEGGELRGPEDEDAYWARMQAAEDERIREVNRTAGIRRAPRMRMKMLVEEWAPGFVANMLA